MLTRSAEDVQARSIMHCTSHRFIDFGLKVGLGWRGMHSVYTETPRTRAKARVYKSNVIVCVAMCDPKRGGLSVTL